MTGSMPTIVVSRTRPRRSADPGGDGDLSMTATLTFRAGATFQVCARAPPRRSKGMRQPRDDIPARTTGVRDAAARIGGVWWRRLPSGLQPSHCSLRDRRRLGPGCRGPPARLIGRCDQSLEKCCQLWRYSCKLWMCSCSCAQCIDPSFE